MPKSEAQPLFFKKPVPIQSDKHAKAGLAQGVDYKFAKPTNSAPINIQEFALVAKTYPIVFTGDAGSLPVAVLGLENSQNVFVDEKNKWEKGLYIPAYIRQYPFGLSVDGEKLTLCIDEGSDKFRKIATGKEAKLFGTDGHSELIKNALDFCANYYTDSKTTANFSAALRDNGMLIERQVNIDLESRKKPIVLGGFKIIDETRLNSLSERLVLEWYRNGYLALINFHLLSLTNWQNLLERL